MKSSHWMSGGLAAAAITSAITLSAPAASAAPGEDRPCGLPAVPAVTTTVVVPPVFETVPAVTHTEWLWSRDLDVHEFEFVRVLKEAGLEVDWRRTIHGPTEYLYTQLVVDSPAIPAVPAVPAVGHEETYEITPAVVETLVEYRHPYTGHLRWERDDWGGSHVGKSWKKTGKTKQEIVTPAVTGTRWVIDTPEVPGKPAVPAVTHVELLWSTEHPGGPWTGPIEKRPGESTVEHATTGGSQPAGEGWVEGLTRIIPAITESGWAEVVPDGTTATGAARVARVEHDKTEATSAEAPEGKGWAKVDGSAVTVIDAEEKQVLVTPGSTFEQILSPALPATEPCVAPPAEENPPTEENAPAPQAAPAVAGAVSPAEVLPNTGGVAWWMFPAGLATALAGAVAVRSSRRGGAAG